MFHIWFDANRPALAVGLFVFYGVRFLMFFVKNGVFSRCFAIPFLNVDVRFTYQQPK